MNKIFCKKNKFSNSFWRNLDIKNICLTCKRQGSSASSKNAVACTKERAIKGCVSYIFASLFISPTESTCETRKIIFYFTSLKALFILKIIKFWLFRYSNVMTSSDAQA